MIQGLQNLALKHLPVSFLRNRLTKTTAKTNTSNNTDKQLLIDVSVIAKEDAKTGIQRVVRNLYQELLLAPPAGYRICPIAATRKQGYCYLPTDFLQQPTITATGMPVAIRSGDLFLGLDLAAHIIPHRLVELLRWKRQGVRMSFFIYDLLPVLEPRWFNPKTTKNFLRWLRALALLADEAIAISHTVQHDFTAWMQNNYNLADSDLPCATIQLGAELKTMYSNQPASEQPLQTLPHWVEHKFILMVGTLEPRKGHADVVDAFEPLWAKGEQTILVIAGKQGWKVEPFMQRLKNHPEIGKRLYWLDSPSDEMLLALYQHCTGLIMASKGEGFGLPLIEAAYFNKPLLVRDIPIFREVAGNTADYFSSTEVNSLEQCLPQWLMKLDKKNQETNTHSIGVTWQEAGLQMVEILLTSTLAQGDEYLRGIKL